MKTLPAEPESFQGWPNRATRAVNLWITNDETDYRYWADQARAAFDDAHDSISPHVPHAIAKAHNKAISTLAERLENHYYAVLLDRLEPSLDSDLMACALAKVEWAAVAEALLDNPA